MRSERGDPGGWGRRCPARSHPRRTSAPRTSGGSTRPTDPTWTPLFALAGGIVAETGGRLSHAAIVAREYAIPAVLGVAGATTRITDGAQITVDGGTGRVTPVE